MNVLLVIFIFLIGGGVDGRKFVELLLDLRLDLVLFLDEEMEVMVCSVLRLFLDAIELAVVVFFVEFIVVMLDTADALPDTLFVAGAIIIVGVIFAVVPKFGPSSSNSLK